MVRAMLIASTLLVTACVGPKGDPGPPGPPGERGAGATFDLAGLDLAGVDLGGGVPPQAVTCTPGQSFCVTSSQIATCTLSGADAVLGTSCATQGSATNPSTCVTTGCPAGQAACCRRQKPLWAWNFTQPAVSGMAYVANYEAVSLTFGKVCVGSGLGLGSAGFTRNITSCPSDAVFIIVGFGNRSTVNPGSTITLPAAGVSLSATVGSVSCSQWSGTVRLDSDLPDWSVTINATCTTPNVTLAIAGTLSGSE